MRVDVPTGWWRPLVLYGGVGLAVMAARGLHDLRIVLIAFVAVAPMVGVILARNMLPAARFLKGLRDAGQGVEVVRDELTWWGERKMRVRTSAGEWRIECWAANSIHLRVRGPAMPRIREVKGNARKAGRAAAPEGAVPREMLRSVFG